MSLTKGDQSFFVIGWSWAVDVIAEACPPPDMGRGRGPQDTSSAAAGRSRLWEGPEWVKRTESSAITSTVLEKQLPQKCPSNSCYDLPRSQWPECYMYFVAENPVISRKHCHEVHDLAELFTSWQSLQSFALAPLIHSHQRYNHPPFLPLLPSVPHSQSITKWNIVFISLVIVPHFIIPHRDYFLGLLRDIIVLVCPIVNVTSHRGYDFKPLWDLCPDLMPQYVLVSGIAWPEKGLDSSKVCRKSLIR